MSQQAFPDLIADHTQYCELALDPTVRDVRDSVRIIIFLHKTLTSSIRILNFSKLCMARWISFSLLFNSKANMDLRDSSGDEDPTLANEIRNVSPNERMRMSSQRPTGQLLDD